MTEKTRGKSSTTSLQNAQHWLMPDNSDQLESRLVFLDTECLVREKFNWRSKSFSRLKELVGSNDLTVLTSSITKSETRSKLREALFNASASLKKHDVILDQLGNGGAIEAINDTGAADKLLRVMDDYFEELKIEEVPLSKNVEAIFDDYFHQRPPFSAKKKSEFPDAFVVASLIERAKSADAKIYVVSSDPDMRACCEQAVELIPVETLAVLISKATVTKSFYDNLLNYLRNDEIVTERLAEYAAAADVRVLGKNRFDRGMSIEAAIGDVHDVNVIDVRVMSRTEDEIVCEVEFEAHLDVSLRVEVDSYGYSEDDYEPSEEISTNIAHSEIFYPEAIIKYDARTPTSLQLKNVGGSPMTEIDASDIDEIRRYR